MDHVSRVQGFLFLNSKWRMDSVFGNGHCMYIYNTCIYPIFSFINLLLIRLSSQIIWVVILSTKLNLLAMVESMRLTSMTQLYSE